MPIKILLAQLNCTVGDLTGNGEKISNALEKAKVDGADIVVTPELAISGYPPEDLLLREDFLKGCDLELESLRAKTENITLVVGHPYRENNRLYNAASIIQNGKIIGRYFKQELPNYHVFDEDRYFDPGLDACVFSVNGVRIGVNICEDIWGGRAEEIDVVENAGDLSLVRAARSAKDAGATVLLVLNASPFHLAKQAIRTDLVSGRARALDMPIVFCNMVGGQDELVFDGASFAVTSNGDMGFQSPAFSQSMDCVEIDRGDVIGVRHAYPETEEKAVYEALVQGVRDYVLKNGFKGAIIGLSGGVDSALTLAVAVDALGAENLTAVMMPSQFTANISLEDARKMAEILDVTYEEIAIKPIFDEFIAGLSSVFVGREFDTTEENLQSRIRGTLLMSMSNKFGSLVLTTGNKSEMSTGYATLYGDMAGGFAVLKDLGKQMVYRLCKYRNSLSQVIPNRIIERPPSAELRPDQLDQDSLPPYDTLDAVVEQYVEQNRSIEEIVQAGYPRADVERIVHLIHINEYKRRQAPPGVRITRRAFGKDWRFPITSTFRGEVGRDS